MVIILSKQFKDLSSLFKHLDKQIKDTIRQDDTNVKNVVVYELQESIKKNVYNAYKSPARNPYRRQGKNGGLLDVNNFRLEPFKDGVSIYSIREGMDRNGEDVYVAEILEGLRPYSIEDVWGYGYETPRHFVDPARKKLSGSKKLYKAFELDLKNSGLSAKLK